MSGAKEPSVKSIFLEAIEIETAVVSVRPYTCNTGIPSISKKFCVSSERGAEPQIRARRLGLIFWRTREKRRELARLSHRPSSAVAFPAWRRLQAAPARAYRPRARLPRSLPSMPVRMRSSSSGTFWK